ncbi:hypothetical protein [Commensalibacter communis]|nr:hypothetical protein [Commensalibacter communis]CAI3960667.1 unnamed protein product [Commensalibacter communis]
MADQNSSIPKIDTSDITNAIFSFKAAVETALNGFNLLLMKKKVVLKMH